MSNRRVNQIIVEVARRRGQSFESVVRSVQTDGTPTPDFFVELLAEDMGWDRAATLAENVDPRSL